MTEHPPRLLSAADAEKVLGIPASTVRSWWRRRDRTDLMHFGLDKRGHPLFEETKLLELRGRGRPRRTTRRTPR